MGKLASGTVIANSSYKRNPKMANFINFWEKTDRDEK